MYMNQISSKNMLTQSQVEQFKADGFLAIREFYDFKTEIIPIQEFIYKIIGIFLKRYSVDFLQPEFAPDTFDAGYQELIAKDRRYGALVYDAVKHIPPFVRLACSEKHDRILSQLRESDMPGVPYGGFGIRIDNPFEEKFRANWHQDYPSQFRSLDGIVLWAPLVSITKDIGPLQVAVNSHHDGIFHLTRKDPDNPEKTGAYGLRLKNESDIVSRYKIVEGICAPGDLLLIDYLNLHASGYNRSNRSRWSMQMRYFNYREPTGQSYDWQGSFAAGTDISKIHPELIEE
jgi:hypothetical protein